MKKEIHLTNRLGQLRLLDDFVTQTTVEMRLDAKLCLRLKLALEEAVTNVIRYAYPGEEGREIIVRMQEEGGKLTITLIDHGVAFDPMTKEKPDLTLGAEERPIGGLGIFLIRQIMDEVRYERMNGQNILTMIKDLG